MERWEVEGIGDPETGEHVTFEVSKGDLRQVQCHLLEKNGCPYKHPLHFKWLLVGKCSQKKSLAWTRLATFEIHPSETPNIKPASESLPSRHRCCISKGIPWFQSKSIQRPDCIKPRPPRFQKLQPFQLTYHQHRYMEFGQLLAPKQFNRTKKIQLPFRKSKKTNWKPFSDLGGFYDFFLPTLFFE